ncbi:MAG: hypothetical protein KatS3mg068_0392 [Candidatus Sericytochromatia bacterium]|nr:MAG: hypothetical protein KatS3mg068_0392 [Candidatus Sericytochromatia bacterium]
MELLGNLPGNSLPSVLKLFFNKKVNGLLDLKDKDFKAFLWFQNGQLLHAVSTKTLILKEMLKRLNLLNEEKEKDLGNVNDFLIDKLLLEKGLVQDKIITYLRSHQIAFTLYKILECEKLFVEFRPSIKLEIGRFDLLPTSYNWLAEIYQNSSYWLELKTKVPKNITKLKRKKINFSLSKEEEKIYNLCDGKRDIMDVILWSSTNYFKAYSLINVLLSKDAIDYEQDTSSLSQNLLKEISKVLDSMDQIPGVKTSFIVDKEGKMLAKDNKKHEDSEINIEMMASIFSNTISNFENNLKGDDSSSELIEQLLVERENGEKTLLYVSGKVVLVAEALKECDWGLLRLSAKRTMNSIKQLIATGG